jgi:hypothetical protein
MVLGHCIERYHFRKHIDYIFLNRAMLSFDLSNILSIEPFKLIILLKDRSIHPVAI